MPMFAQVWLWSLFAFLLGTLLCWLLVARPARSRIGVLESRLATVRADAALAGRAEPDGRVSDRYDDRPPASPNLVPGVGEGYGHDEASAESLTRAYALPGVRDVPVTPVEPADGQPADPTQYIGTLGAPLVQPRSPSDEPPGTGMRHADGRDWFDDEAAADAEARSGIDLPSQPTDTGIDQRLVDDAEEDDDVGTIFTQHTTPIPAELIRQLDEASRSADAASHRLDESLVDDLDDEPSADGVYADPPAMVAADPATEVSSRIDEPAPAETTLVNAVEADLGEPDAGGPEADESGPPGPGPTEFGMVPSGPSANGSGGQMPVLPDGVSAMRSELASRIMPDDHTATFVPVLQPDAKVGHGVTVEPERTQSALPKRIPAKPQRTQTFHPFGVETVTPAVSTGQERTRSLFEPMVPAEGEANAVPPPPHRLHSGEVQAPGPFGPGSAMPLASGASPSPEFTIKASVTALRYCTPESPQFGKTVAEVWFRSAADAERVGFRPVG